MQSVILGTAQWGLTYGTTNSVGRLPDDEIVDIIGVARRSGVSGLDTAPAYGDAEARIGDLATDLPVQTKVSAAGRGRQQILSTLAGSLERLNRDSVTGVLVHDWSLLEPMERRQVAEVLEEIRAEGLAARVGVSAYAAVDVATALDAFSRLDVAQVPVNVLDQRLEQSPEIMALRSQGGCIQARSVFLQGAALAPSSHPLFGSHPDVLRLREVGTPLDLCLGYVATRPWIDELVLAVTSATELKELIATLHRLPPDVVWSDIASSDAQLLDPRLWTAPTREG